ncbi:MAG: sodium:phosphate symporter [Halanaeroarchaeum sp.]
MAPALGPVLRRSLDPDVSALGAGWLAAAALLNGSVVAAVAISLAGAGVLTARKLFLLVVGSRLGAAVVVLVGALDHLQRRGDSLPTSVGLGLLTFVVTHSIYLPVAVLGYLGLPWVRATVDLPGGGLATTARPLASLGGPAAWLHSLLGGPATFAVAIALFLASLRTVDRLAARVETERLETRYLAVVDHPWRSFAVGLVATALTTSVAVSVGIVVPLYNRGYLDREQMVPYLLGASLGTLTDSLLVAVVVGAPTGVLVVALVLAVGTVLTLVAMVGQVPYGAGVGVLHDKVTTDWRWLAAFAVGVVGVPAALVATALLS